MDEKGKYTKVAAELRRRYREGDDPEAAAEIPKFEDAKRTVHSPYDALVNAVTGSDNLEARRAIIGASQEDLETLKEEYDLEGIDEAGNTDLNTLVTERIELLSKSDNTSKNSSSVLRPPSSPSKPELVQIGLIVETVIDELQMREDIDSQHVDDLKDCLDDLPPITVFADDIRNSPSAIRYFIGDGWHRFLAHKLSSKKQIKAIVHPGGKDAALRCALGANAEHNALRRTNRDKRKAVERALKSYNTILGSGKIKNVSVAELCKVTEGLVRKIRKEMEDAGAKTENQKTENGSTDGGEAGAQIDFFAQLNASFKPVEQGLKECFSHTYFLNPDIQKKDKLEAIEGIERNLKASLQEARDLKAKLAAQEETETPES